jgi:hypothetical protein
MMLVTECNMATKPKSGKAGTGRPEAFCSTDIGADMVPTVDSNGEPRKGFTRRVYSSPAAPTTFSKNCAGGDHKRFDALKRQAPGEYPDLGDTWDRLPGVTP